MTLKEAADRLGVAPSTLRVQLRNGKLRGVKRGRDWWITPAEVDRYGKEHGTQVHRCRARYPGHPEQVRCEDETGHTGPHFHSFYMRSWEDEPEPTEHSPKCRNRSCVAGCRKR
jgi:excisionase family DNA binding protein